jgi:hypothetical protein
MSVIVDIVADKKNIITSAIVIWLNNFAENILFTSFVKLT